MDGEMDNHDEEPAPDDVENELFRHKRANFIASPLLSRGEVRGWCYMTHTTSSAESADTPP